MLEKDATRLKQGRAKSRDIHMQNESFKKIVMKLGVNHEDKSYFEALLQISQTEIKESRHKLKMPSSEHV